MAYGTKYYLEQFTNGGIPYTISIKKEGYTDPPTRLYLNKDGLRIDYDLSGWSDTVMVLTVKLSIINDASVWYAYEDLFTLENKEFQMVIDASYDGSNVILFDGWINSSPVVQKYLHNSIINITGSNFVARMDKLSPPILYSQDASNGDARSFIDLINGAFQLTGKNDDIIVNCQLEPSSGTISSTKTLFNTCGVNPQIFFANNTDKESGLDLLKDILVPFNCYSYWYNGDWYIERYADLAPSDGSKGYVKYSYPTEDVSYFYSSTGTAIAAIEPSLNLPIACTDGSITFTNASQTLSMIPGLEYIEVELDESPVLNLTINDFSQITGGSFPSVHYPSYRKWNATQFTTPITGTGWHFPGYQTYGLFDISCGYSFEPTRSIFFSTDSSYWGQYTTGAGRPYSGIQNALLRWGVPQRYSGGSYVEQNKHYAGISTRFKLTISNEMTKINIKWKFLPISTGSGGPGAWDYKCYYTLRIPPASNWLTYDEENSRWFYHTTSTFANYVNTVEVNGADLNEQGYKEISIDVPVGDVSGWISSGNTQMIFSILGEDIKKNTATEWNTSQYPLFAAYGDVYITAESGIEPEDNKFIAQLNKNVLNSQKVVFKIYDSPSLMIDNGILTGSYYGYRTNYWKEKDGSTYRNLVDWYIHDRYKLYSENRREITGEINYKGHLKPMSVWYDNYDPINRPYILTAYSYNVQKDTYICTWLEYDNNTEVTVTDAGVRPNTLVDPKGTTTRTPPTGDATTTPSTRVVSTGDRTVRTLDPTVRDGLATR